MKTFFITSASSVSDCFAAVCGTVAEARKYAAGGRPTTVAVVRVEWFQKFRKLWPAKNNIAAAKEACQKMLDKDCRAALSALHSWLTDTRV